MFWQIFSTFELWVRTSVLPQRGTDPTIKATAVASTAAPNPGSVNLPIDGTPPQFKVTASWLDFMISGMARTINHATTSFSPYIAHAKAVTTARTGGIIAAFEAQLTGLAGDTSAATFAAFKGLAPTTNGGSAVYAWGYVAAGYTRLLDLTAVATGQAIIAVKDNLASALEIKEGSTSIAKIVSTDAGEKIVLGYPLETLVEMKGAGASTAAAGTTTADATALPARTGSVYPTTAADDTKGVRIHANDNVAKTTLFVANTVSNKILKIYPPSGGTINGAAADAAFSTASGKGAILYCSAAGTWFAW